MQIVNDSWLTEAVPGAVSPPSPSPLPPPPPGQGLLYMTEHGNTEHPAASCIHAECSSLGHSDAKPVARVNNET